MNKKSLHVLTFLLAWDWRTGQKKKSTTTHQFKGK